MNPLVGFESTKPKTDFLNFLFDGNNSDKCY